MRKFLTVFFLFISASSHSQDLLAGEISFSHISGYTYQINGSIYAQTRTAIPRTYFLLYIGAASADTVPVAPPPDSTSILVYHFSATHTYPGPGIYDIHLEGDFLVDSVVNLPNSVHKPLYLDAQLVISPTTLFDNAPVFSQPPVGYGQEGLLFIYNSDAYDVDGDSLSYLLIAFDSTSSYSGVNIDSVIGDIKIPNPQAGRYLLRLRILEWRLISGVRVEIGYVERVIYINIEKATGIKEISGDEILNIFPNPAISQLYIHASAFGDDEKVTVSIIDVLGQEASPSAPLQMRGESDVIDISNLRAGMYFLSLKSENWSVVKKFVKE